MLGVVWAQRSTERLWTLQNRTIMLLIETEITSWCINIGEGARTPLKMSMHMITMLSLVLIINDYSFYT